MHIREIEKLRPMLSKRPPTSFPDTNATGNDGEELFDFATLNCNRSGGRFSEPRCIASRAGRPWVSAPHISAYMEAEKGTLPVYIH